MMECIAYVSQNVQQLQISVLLKIGLLFALHIFHLPPPPLPRLFQLRKTGQVRGTSAAHEQ